jgi:hypothetical protein
MEALFKNWLILALCACVCAVVSFMPTNAAAAIGPSAGVFELSGTFSFNDNNYGGGNYEWTRRWSGSFGYHLSELSEIELSFQDVLDRTMIGGFEDTTFHDRIYSVDWVQALIGKDFPVQPYVKVGVGQLNRDATGSYVGGAVPPLELDQLTVLAGAGVKVFLSHAFGLKAEATTYLVGGSISTYSQNFSVNFGISIYF